MFYRMGFQIVSFSWNSTRVESLVSIEIEWFSIINNMIREIKIE